MINEYKRAGAVKDYQNYLKMAAGGFMEGSMSELKLPLAGPGKKKRRKKKKSCGPGGCGGGGRKWKRNRFKN